MDRTFAISTQSGFNTFNINLLQDTNRIIDENLQNLEYKLNTKGDVES